MQKTSISKEPLKPEHLLPPHPLNIFLLGGETAVTVGPCACDRAMTDKSEEAPAPSTSAVSLEKSEEGEVPSALARKRQERKEETRQKTTRDTNNYQSILAVKRDLSGVLWNRFLGENGDHGMFKENALRQSDKHP